jgi:hypothetical protein
MAMSLLLKQLTVDCFCSLPSLYLLPSLFLYPRKKGRKKESLEEEDVVPPNTFRSSVVPSGHRMTEKSGRLWEPVQTRSAAMSSTVNLDSDDSELLCVLKPF